ncbi:MAG: efflux RND transporter permease subunit [Pseudomonadales bacterium]|nr:efflux RND transporter permease subunit [Pseudomonadales bacterium]
MSEYQSNTFSTWAIRNPLPPIVLFLVLTIAGLVAYKQLPINNMPAIVIPVISVQISQPGAAATEIETQITRIVESALAGLQGVKHITSVLSEGSSQTTIEFHLDTDVDRAVNDTRDAIARVRDQLPNSILEPKVQRLDTDGGAILTYSLEAPDMQPEDISWFIDDTLSRELLSVSGVTSVSRQGGTEHEITLTLDPQRLMSLGISAAEISRQLALTNVDLPGGRITLSGTEYSLRTLGSAQSVALLKEVRISISGGREVRLADLGALTDGGAEQRQVARLDGKPVATFQVFKSQGTSEVTIAQGVEKKLEEIKTTHPYIRFNKIFSTAEETETTFQATIINFFEGAALTVLVVFLFLRDKRATMVAVVAIPLSIIPTFLFMSWMGFSLNGISLLAITLVIGVLVDDAIVEIENIHRHMREGKSPKAAAMIAADEIGLAVVATTAVICAVFTPVSFMGGIPGQFFIQFGMTVSVAAIFSLAVARLLTPMLSAYLLKPPKHDFKPASWLKHYHRLVIWTLDNRLKTMGIALLSMVLSFSMIPFISSGAIPYEDIGQSRLSIELPRGSTLEQTDSAAQKVMKIFKAHKEVAYVLTSVGGDASGNQRGFDPVAASGVNKANIDVKLVPVDKRDIDQREFEQKILPELKTLPDMRITFANNNGEKDISITLVGENGAALETAATAIEREMRKMPELLSVSSSASLVQPEIIITPDFAKASALGVSVQSISDAINVGTIGDIEANLAKFNYGNRQIPIRVRLPNDKQTIGTIENLQLPTTNGKSVPLSAIAMITYGSGPTTIDRYDRQRKIAVEANLNGGALGDALEKINALPIMNNLPDGVRVQNSGDAEFMQELFGGFFRAIGAGLLLVYAIQVLLYKDWIQPFTRMAALPLAIGGTFILMLLTGTELSLPAMIGILMLMGIADKNSILLVDCMLERIHQGMPRRQAIIEACEIRARPILMTSFAMIAGMLPIALGFSLDSAVRGPMAIAVIGGLFSSTALSLIFVPTMFSYIRDFEEWSLPKLKRLVS